MYQWFKDKLIDDFYAIISPINCPQDALGGVLRAVQRHLSGLGAEPHNRHFPEFFLGTSPAPCNHHHQCPLKQRSAPSINCSRGFHLKNAVSGLYVDELPRSNTIDWMRAQVMAEYSTKTADLPDALPDDFGSEPQSAQEIHRAAWFVSRAAREQKNTKLGVVKRRSKLRAKIRNFLFGVGAKIVKAIGLHDLLANRAAKLVLTKLDFHFHDLPPAFDGYRILHISDPHFDSLPQLEEAMLVALDGRSVDLAVVTGDIADQFNGPWKTFLPPMRRLISEIAPADGFYAELGNHDSWRMVAPLEALGVTMLINETAIIDNEGSCISLTGVDAPSNFY